MGFTPNRSLKARVARSVGRTDLRHQRLPLLVRLHGYRYPFVSPATGVRAMRCPSRGLYSVDMALCRRAGYLRFHRGGPGNHEPDFRLRKIEVTAAAGPPPL